MAGADKTEYVVGWRGESLDAEWVFLMLEAKEAGLTVEEIRSFLQTGAHAYTANKGILLTGTND
jgi:hypothetical protein